MRDDTFNLVLNSQKEPARLDSRQKLLVERAQVIEQR